MDLVSIGFLVLAVLYPVSGLLVYKVGRWVERKEAEAKMLRAQVEELKAMIAGADFKALEALRAYQTSEAEAGRAKMLLGK